MNFVQLVLSIRYWIFDTDAFELGLGLSLHHVLDCDIAVGIFLGHGVGVTGLEVIVYGGGRSAMEIVSSKNIRACYLHQATFVSQRFDHLNRLVESVVDAEHLR